MRQVTSGRRFWQDGTLVAGQRPEELRRPGWPEAGFGMQPKGHRAQVTIARRLRQKTTMSLK